MKQLKDIFQCIPLGFQYVLRTLSVFCCRGAIRGLPANHSDTLVISGLLVFRFSRCVFGAFGRLHAHAVGSL